LFAIEKSSLKSVHQNYTMAQLKINKNL
jgi:hypothetical protein